MWSNSAVTATITINPTVNITYTVTGTNSATGCSNTKILSVTVKPSPLANFTFLPNNSCSGILINFTNTSTGTSLNYSWNFGDGNISTLQNPTHTFLGATGSGTQNYSVTLQVTNSSGCSNSTSQTITINQTPRCFIADYDDNPNSYIAEQEILF